MIILVDSALSAPILSSPSEVFRQSRKEREEKRVLIVKKINWGVS